MSEPELLIDPQNQPSTFEVNRINDYSQYLLYSKSEILMVLRTLIQKGVMITVHFNQGKSFLLSSLLALGSENATMILDTGNDESMNRKVVEADKLIFTTFIDRVKVQFSLEKLTKIQYEGRPAFSGQIPDKVLRLQRREFFRLSIPMATRVNLLASVSLPDKRVLELDFPLWDISGGGVGLVATTDQATQLQRGDIWENCKIDLPDEGSLIATVKLCNMFEVTTRTGTRLVRVGCEFINTPASRLNIIQRYITRVERERKARINGLV